MEGRGAGKDRHWARPHRNIWLAWEIPRFGTGPMQARLTIVGGFHRAAVSSVSAVADGCPNLCAHVPTVLGEGPTYDFHSIAETSSRSEKIPRHK